MNFGRSFHLMFCVFCAFLWQLSLWLTRDGFVGFGDADPVIGEGGVHAGQLDFRHVAGRAFRRTDGTRRGASSLSLRVFCCG